MTRPSGPVVTTRRLGPEDWRSWREIRLRALQDSPSAFGSTYASERSRPEAFWRERLSNPDNVAVLAESAARSAGMAGGFRDLPGLLHVVAMWVDPGHRRHGVAHLVLDSVRDWGRDRGLRLHLDVETTNEAARRCYERYGFVATGETRPIREGSPDLVERMALG